MTESEANSPTRRILGGLYRIERSQDPIRPVVTAIEFDTNSVIFELVDQSRAVLNFSTSGDEAVYAALKACIPGLAPAKRGVLPMLLSESVENNWIELHYDLASYEDFLTSDGHLLRYKSVKRVGDHAVIETAGPLGVKAFEQTLAVGVEPVGVVFDLIESYSA